MTRLPRYCGLLSALAALTALGASGAHAQDSPSAAKPYVSALFGDNMVLQRNRPVPVWGWTTPGQKIVVTAQGKRASSLARPDGYWKATLPPLAVGPSFTVTVQGPQTVTFHDVLAGDVWLCTGQSNMEFGLGNIDNAAEEIAKADYPNIRLFKVGHDIALTPQTQLLASWAVCTPSTIKQGGWNGFSAVGYFFGRDLYQTLHVPIGLIESDWGGTPAEAWTSARALATMPDFQPAVAQLAQEQTSDTSATPAPAKPAVNQNTPTVLFNGMINPLTPYAVTGAIWYQGETNAGRAFQYRTLLPTMIGDWRTHWGQGAFPFLIVQLAGWQPGGAGWAELREAQWLTAKRTPNAGIATAADIGNAQDIHPHNKREVGRRLALVAEAKVYHKQVEDAGPVYQSARVQGDSVRLTFTHLGGGLVAKDGAPLTGFTVAGSDQKFVDATARIDGSTVVVSSPQVPQPVAVRYAWAAYPACSLYNKAGLPAFPFRTDDWPGTTDGSK